MQPLWPEPAATLFLANALGGLLGRPRRGAMAYARCLQPWLVRQLAADAAFVPGSWKVAAVVEQRDDGRRWITADEAVAWREDKGDPVLLLVDSAAAGAGMDGIYSATREITEDELFKAAQKTARAKVQRGCKGFVDAALKKARGVLRTHQQHLAPLQAYAYLCRAASCVEEAGAALPLLGLWPIAMAGRKPSEADLDKAVHLVECLLPMQRSSMTPEQRVAALQLPDEEARLAEGLIARLRDVDNLPRLEALHRVTQEQMFWMHSMHPVLFDTQSVRKIHWVNWRGRHGRPLAWSGLHFDTQEQRLEWRLAKHAEQSTAQGRIKVCWQTEPETLAKGTVEYLVEVRSDSDLLAHRRVTHSGRSMQSVTFSQDDLDDLQEDARFEAQVHIRTLDKKPRTAESEEFLLCFGEETGKPLKSSTGRVFATMALAAAHVAQDKASFLALAANPQDMVRDDKGFISCRSKDRVARVHSPHLFDELCRDWIERDGMLGRWRVRLRADGARLGGFSFIPAGQQQDPFRQAARQFAAWLAKGKGLLGAFYPLGAVMEAEAYVTAALAAWQDGDPDLMRIHTLEVLAPDGQCLGCIVLPIHPLRLAWQQGYDALIAHHRYERGLGVDGIVRYLKQVTGAHYPAFLPADTPGRSYVFADMLGQHAVAMVSDDDPEPKATVALMRRLLDGADETAPTAPSAGAELACVLATEIGRYVATHPAYGRIQVHALRAGDGQSITRALGKTFIEPKPKNDEHDPQHDEHLDDDNALCYELNLYPGSSSATLQTGNHLAAITQQRRSKGAAAVPAEDRWMLESNPRPGGVRLPRLRWMLCREQIPQQPAHLAVAFDVFHSQLGYRSRSAMPASGILEVHGLMLMPVRLFFATPEPHWLSHIPPDPIGKPHPADPSLSMRLTSLHALILQATAHNLGGGSGDWPVACTTMTEDQHALLNALHGRCDWVITVDRNAGIEYFDSPHELGAVYAAYIIDCAPERNELGFMQLITTTGSLDEVTHLLGTALGEMGLSLTESHCRSLLDGLKAISGRLALRLAGAGMAAQELVAMALVQQHCGRCMPTDEVWLPLQEGFFVPLDDLPELFDTEDAAPAHRADLLFVHATPTGELGFVFVEVKFRRLLKMAHALDLVQHIHQQLEETVARFKRFFDGPATDLRQTIRHALLGRILHFYARKGRRHHLREAAYQHLVTLIDQLAQGAVGLPARMTCVGYVFCPEYQGRAPIPLSQQDGPRLWLFGPQPSPGATVDGCAPVSSHRPSAVGQDQASNPPAAPMPHPPPALLESDKERSPPLKPDPHPAVHPEPPAVMESPTDASDARGMDDAHSPGEGLVMTGKPATASQEEVAVHLGTDGAGGHVFWKLGIATNPHLMILGLPGMGKTTALINICTQLATAGMIPIIFSYHQDIDEKFDSRLGGRVQMVRYDGLGFNPMEVSSAAPKAYLDNVGMIRDIFAAIFPELGNVQLGRLREALKTSYHDLGWNVSGRQDKKTPAFGAFVDILAAEAKPEQNLLIRLDELKDYRFFDDAASIPSLLDSTMPVLIQIHGTQNEYLQRAFASFVLHNIYQRMFQRGPQQHLSHVIIFDEAHRAARLKLMAPMAKECRKYGLAFVAASQEAKDFDDSLFNAIANFLVLRLNDADARLMARHLTAADQAGALAERIKQLPRYQALCSMVDGGLPVVIALSSS